MPDVCTSCFGVKYWCGSRFKLFWGPLDAWFGIGITFEKIWGGGGGIFVAPKIYFYFFARANFLRQPLVTLETFVFDRFSILFLICSKNALVKMAVSPPPSCSCRHFWVGTSRYLYDFRKIKIFEWGISVVNSIVLILFFFPPPPPFFTVSINSYTTRYVYLC